MRRALNQDTGSGLLFLALGAAFAWGAHGYALGSAAAPGPGYLPLGLGLALAAIGALLVLRGLSRGQAALLTRPAWRPLAALIAGVLVFALAVPRAGLAVALPLLVCVLALGRPRARWREVALTAGVLTVGCGLVFIHGLGVPMHWWG